MTFLNILGLLGLLGVLALFIIYILKPKYLERTIGSSFIWKLSLKYKKRKVPFEWVKSSLLIFIQVLILVLLTIILMKPNLILKQSSGEKIAILDISASMLADQNGETRLDNAKSEIEKLARDTINNNDKFTLIVAGQEAEILAYRTDSMEFIRTKLNDVKSTYSTSNIDDSITLTEDIVQLNPTAEVIYYTSNDYKDAGEVTIRNMSDDEWNMSVLSVVGEYDLSLNYVFTVEVASYGKDIDNAVLQLDIDGVRETSTTVDLIAGEVTTFTWKIPGLNQDTYSKATVKYLDIDDDFIYDNQLSFYSNTEPFYVQIVTPDTPEEINTTKEYITRAMRSLDYNFSIVTKTDLSLAATTEYDLYIYIDEVPDVLPKDGAIWIFNPDQLPTSLDMVIGNDVSPGVTALSGTDSSSIANQEIMNLVRPGEITVSKYKEVSNYGEYDVLLQASGDPVVLTRNKEKVKITVFTFGFDYSNLPILFFDFPVLVRNLSEYSVQSTFNKDVVDASTEVLINENPMTETIIVTTNEGETIYTSFPVILETTTLGTHKITQILRDGRVITDSFFVRVPKEESDFDYIGDIIESNTIVDTDVPILEKDNLRDLVIYISIALFVLLLIEWEVQHREQY